MALLELPAELLYLIATRLDTRSLSQLILTSQYFNLLLTPYLHKLALQLEHDRFTPLQWAAWKSYLPLVKLILKLTNNANINKCSPTDGGNALSYAIITCRRWAGTFVEVVRVLLDAGADVKAKGCKGASPLRLAIFKGHEHEELFKILLDAGSDIEERNGAFGTPLCIAALLGRTDLLSLFLARKPPGYVTVASNISEALQAGVVAGQVEVVRMLLDKGADIGTRVGNGRTLAHIAVSADKPEVLRLLVERGVPLDLVDERRQTVLEYAAMSGRLMAVDILLRAGWTAPTKNNALSLAAKKDGRTAVELTVMYGNTNFMSTFLEFSADVNIKSDRGEALLMLVLDVSMVDQETSDEREKEIKFVITCTADIDITDTKNALALDDRWWKEREEIVRFLLDHGADVNAQDSDGLTALHKVLALDSGYTYVLLDLLLGNGADVNVRDKFGLTALHLGRTYHMLKILYHGADMDATNNNGQTPLHVAVRSGKDLAATMLWNLGADANVVDVKGRSPLILAAMYRGTAESIRLLSGVCAGVC
ncbi:ankyrin repeat-containing domain protein [Morchella snyderi]|nr:ankyrin repeat-containing domain protein [Morchella snyderi]